ncbi:tyrosinase family oxidase copper chaperone [Actinoplanes aureus]|uniref:Uncharacterized protein n=1 Tax=Actinoplanes aureus TaxID=2792083 RepID=A0A931G0V9_9ACTN|nr:tyrosinase family oxidase copper chaperone [Actinoplanes aureus]MBG0566112.1 hypothetical protein [Actinoplanes aureus]
MQQRKQRQRKQRAKTPGNARRALTTLAVAVGVMATAGSAAAAPAAPPVPSGNNVGFFETYRGHHIMGWGHDESACAYIDGKRLVLYPAGKGLYTSSLQGYQQERGLRAITKASVRVLGDLDMVDATEPPGHCPAFKIRPKDKGTAVSG